MKIGGKGRHTSVSLMIVVITIFGILYVLSSNTFAQAPELSYDKTLYQMASQTSGLNKTAQINVGKEPGAIGVNDQTNTIYVVNTGISANSVSVISGENNTKIKDIDVGDGPTAIGVSETTNTIYVLNKDNDSVSVISGENNTKIKDIPVGPAPQAIGVDDFGVPDYPVMVYVTKSCTLCFNEFGPDTGSVSVISGFNNTNIKNITVGNYPVAIAALGNAYVANEYNSVSVISGFNNTNIKNITVGDSPVAITPFGDYVYVANERSDSVSVISRKNLTNIKNITVGDSPVALGFNQRAYTIYVVNHDSNSVSVIESISNEILAGVTFKVNPFNSGYIVCDDPTTPSPDDTTPRSPIGQYMYVYSGSQCTAKPNEGFDFSSWEENLEGNSTQPLQASHPASLWDAYLKYRQIQPDAPEAKLNITKFGTFTANFKEVPAPLPPEFWAQMYAVIATVVTALFIPSIVGWIRSKRDLGKLNYYHKEIDSLYADGKLDENDMEELDQLRIRVTNAYSEGKVNEKHYETLRGEISTLYEEIFRKKIAALDGRNNYSVVRKPIQEQLAQTKNEIKYAFSKGKITEKHYDLLNEDISNLDGKENATQKQAKTPSHAGSK